MERELISKTHLMPNLSSHMVLSEILAPGVLQLSSGARAFLLEMWLEEQLCDNRFSSGHNLCYRILRETLHFSICILNGESPGNWERSSRGVILNSRAFLMDEEICVQPHLHAWMGLVPLAGIIPGLCWLCSGCQISRNQQSPWKTFWKLTVPSKSFVIKRSKIKHWYRDKWVLWHDFYRPCKSNFQIKSADKTQ